MPISPPSQFKSVRLSANPIQPQSRVSTLAIYLGFAGTGVCMALPGSILPALLARWSLADSQAGLLLFFSWLGSSIGALLVRPPLTRSIVIGSALLVLSGLGMAGVAGSYGWSCYWWMGLFGLGLGITMTSVSLLQAARHAQNRGGELNRLNLAWSIGACLGPTIAEHSLRIVDVRSIFGWVSIFFGFFGGWVALAERNIPAAFPSVKVPGSSKPIWPLAFWPFLLACTIFLPTGIESSMGGWTAAYVDRSQQTISATVTAGTCFWMGLLVSRTASSWLLRKRSWERLILLESLIIVVLGFLLLIGSNAALGILAGVFLIGLGLGPIYPLLLAVALEYSDNTAIFFVAGLGSAIIPWVTGQVSSRSSSLRIGLYVPLASSILMLLLGLRLMGSTWKLGSKSA